MPRLILTALLVSSSLASAQAPRERKEAREEALKKKETAITPDKSLAGDISRKKETKAVAPTLTYDNVRLGLELSAASKRRELIEDLKKIIEFSQDKKEKPNLFFRLGELYWEESKYFFFEANRKDDEKLQAMNRDDKAGMERAEAEKQEILAKSKEFGQMAMEQYSTIVQQYKDYERTDEVLYFLGLNLMEMGDEKKGVAAYKRLVDKYKKSKYQPDAWLALGEYYFNNSKGKREYLDKALEAYKAAAGFTDSAVYGYAMYKQGWCYFNMSDFDKAMDQFKAVILYADFAGTSEVEGDKKGKGSRAGLVKEARADFVRAFSRGAGSPTEAKDKFVKLTKTPDELRLMMRQLANLLYEDGKDKEAAQTFDMLIKERPTSPEAPGFQSKIIDCVMRSGNKRITVQQVRRLVKIQDDVLSKNAKLEDKDKKALDEARELSERTISNLAVNWHNEAKKTRDDETFGLANEVYADYLTLFPDNPKSYELRFFWSTLLFDNLNKYEKAAEEYTKVFLVDVAKIEKGGNGPDGKPLKPGKFMNDAAYNSIFAWDEVVKAAVTSGEIKPEPISDPTKKGTIPAKKKSLLEACERYLKYVDKGDKKVEITYKVAKIYYDYNWLDEAVQRFADIAMNHPDHKFADGDKAGEIAANLILDSYNLQGDWGKVNEWARKFYGNEKLAQGKFKDDLAKLIEQSSFKLVNQLESRKDYGKAAEAYMTFVNEFPRSELADKALFNASIDFFNAKMLDKAIEVRKQIIQRYPRSPHVPAVMFALAEGYEAITSFTEAAEYYETYAANYEKTRGPGGRKAAPRAAPKKGAPAAKDAPEQVWEEQKAQDAIFNAGIFRDGLGQYAQALKLRMKYLELWPDSKESEAVTKSITDLYEKMGAWSKVNASLEDYEKKFIRDPNKVLTAEGRIANVFEEKLKNPAGAKRIYLRITDYYEKLPKKQREALEITALDAVARADFLANEKDWAYYSGLKLKWSTLQNVGELKATIKNKAAALEEIQKKYTKTVTYKSADPAICALHKIGLAYDQFASQLENPPVPKGIPEELLVEVKAQFSDQAKPVKDKAAEAFAAAVQKSQELDVFNPCTTQSLEQLRTKYRPEQFPKMSEDVPEVKLEAGREMVIGQDILTAIQTVTVLSPEKAQEMKSKAREVGRDTADMKPSNNAEIDLTGPAPTPTPAPRKGSAAPTPAPTPSKTPATPGKQPKNADTEPEEPL